MGGWQNSLTCLIPAVSSIAVTLASSPIRPFSSVFQPRLNSWPSTDGQNIVANSVPNFTLRLEKRVLRKLRKRVLRKLGVWHLSRPHPLLRDSLKVRDSLKDG